MHLQPVISAPVTEPISLDTMKGWLKVEFGDDDALIGSLISAAREWATAHTGLICAGSVQVVERYETWPIGGVFVPGYGPILSVTTLKYYDADNVLQTVSGSEYYYEAGGEAGAVCMKDSFTNPSLYGRPGAVVLTYTAGFSEVPSVMITAMRLMVAYWYENRVDSPKPQHSLRAAESLLRAWKRR